jgi:hypothetical protein
VTWASKNRGGHTACDDGEVECIGCGSGEGTTGATGASVVIKGDGESNGSLGDSGRECDRKSMGRRSLGLYEARRGFFAQCKGNQTMGARLGFMSTQGGPSVCML